MMAGARLQLSRMYAQYAGVIGIMSQTEIDFSRFTTAQLHSAAAESK